MKLHIVPTSDRFSAHTEKSTQFSSTNLVANRLNAGLVRETMPIIEMQDQPDLSQIDSALDSFDITALLNPAMFNTGGMEVLATIKRDLKHQIEATLACR